VASAVHARLTQLDAGGAIADPFVVRCIACCERGALFTFKLYLVFA
jgi:hypothetical protein